jgi:hypothetical protein
MTEIAKAAGLGRESLYKALRPNSQPRMETMTRVLGALGVRLVAELIGNGETVTEDGAPRKAVAAKPRSRGKPAVAKPAAAQG